MVYGRGGWRLVFWENQLSWHCVEQDIGSAHIKNIISSKYIKYFFKLPLKAMRTTWRSVTCIKKSTQKRLHNSIYCAFSTGYSVLYRLYLLLNFVLKIFTLSLHWKNGWCRFDWEKRPVKKLPKNVSVIQSSIDKSKW